MALQFIFGSSGSGKTEWLYRRLLETAKTEKKKMIYLIVPEQFTLQAQKAIVARQENHAVFNIDAVSFERLAYRVFDELGTENRTVLEDTGKSLILRRLAEENRDRLTVLKSQIRRPGYIDQVKSLISEFMQYGFTAERLREYLRTIPQKSALYYKLSDIRILYEAFEEYLSGGFVTAERLLEVLADCVPESKLLSGAVLAFDGFTGFTPVQMKLLRRLFGVCSQAYVAVTIDPGREVLHGRPLKDFRNDKNGQSAETSEGLKAAPGALQRIAEDRGLQELFYMSRKMIRTVSRAAEENGCRVEDPVVLFGEKGRFAGNEPLSFLEKNLFRNNPGTYYFSCCTGTAAGVPGEGGSMDTSRREEKASAVSGESGASRDSSGNVEKAEKRISGPEKAGCSPNTVISAVSLATPREELIYAADQIRELTLSGACRCSEIAVVSGRADVYENYAAEVFGSYGIPYFSDSRKPVSYHPFTEWLRALIEIIRKNFSRDSVFRCLRTGLCGFSAEEIDILENYALERGISSYKKWSRKWTIPPGSGRKKSGKEEEEQEALLERLNGLRVRLLEMTSPLRAAAEKKDATVSDYTKAVYDTAVSLGIEEQLEKMKEKYEARGEESRAAASAQIYRIVMDLFDKMVDLLGEEAISLREYAEILDSGLRAARVGVVPPGIDCVTLGDIERTRLDGIRVLFFLGVNDGVIPKAEERKQLLSEYDRVRMKGDHIELAPTAREQVFLQRFYLYLNLTKPSARLYLTYSRMDSSGKEQKPSYLIRTVGGLFPDLQIEERAAGMAGGTLTPQNSAQEFLRGLEEARRGDVSPEWGKLVRWRMGRPDLKGETERLFGAAFYSYEGKELEKGLARRIYGNELRQSATKLKEFFSCPYAYFMQYGLALSERPVFEFKPNNAGSLFHESLAGYGSLLKERGAGWTEISGEERKRLAAAAWEAAKGGTDLAALTETARGSWRLDRYADLFSESVDVITRQLQKGDFAPAEYELPFRLEIPLAEEEPGAGRIILNGSIDRLDLFEEGGNVYLKVVDYKSGNEEFRLQNVYEGRQLQLILYLLGADPYLRARYPSGKIVPAGVLYYRLDRPEKDISEGMKDGKFDPDFFDRKLFAALRPDGLVNPDGILHLDRTGSGKSDVIPVSINKDGSLSKNSRNSLATAEQFETLRKFSAGKVREGGRKILSGDIAVSPVVSGKEDSCRYCPYCGVCGFDARIPGFRKKQMPDLGNTELWEKMEEAVRDETGTQMDGKSEKRQPDGRTDKGKFSH